MSDEGPVMYVPAMDAFLNRWHASYAEARTCLEAEGGFLLPFGEHFFVTKDAGIRELGLDPEDPDWARIGWDWVRPQDREAWERLRWKRELAS